MAQDDLASFEPAFVDDLAVILRWAFEAVQRSGTDEADATSWLRDFMGGAIYLRLSTPSIEQPGRNKYSQTFTRGYSKGL